MQPVLRWLLGELHDLHGRKDVHLDDIVYFTQILHYQIHQPREPNTVIDGCEEDGYLVAKEEFFVVDSVVHHPECHNQGIQLAHHLHRVQGGSLVQSVDGVVLDEIDLLLDEVGEVCLVSQGRDPIH